jgi:hypothetical protein
MLCCFSIRLGVCDGGDGGLVWAAGFTPLTERMSQKGMSGVEELSRHLNAYFGPICERIYEYVASHTPVLKIANL